MTITSEQLNAACAAFMATTDGRALVDATLPYADRFNWRGDELQNAMRAALEAAFPHRVTMDALLGCEAGEAYAQDVAQGKIDALCAALEGEIEELEASASAAERYLDCVSGGESDADSREIARDTIDRYERAQAALAKARGE